MLYEDSADLVHSDATIGRLERSGAMIVGGRGVGEVREDGLGGQEIIYLGKQIQKDWQRLKRSNEGVTMTNAW